MVKTDNTAATLADLRLKLTGLFQKLAAAQQCKLFQHKQCHGHISTGYLTI